ncbi:MAG: TolB family protein [Gemmatimonadaceae bacterium]
MIVRTCVRSLCGIAAVATLANAQYLTRPAQPWETMTTTSFRIHYPAEMRAWVHPIAERMESYAAAVHDLVGSKPPTRTTVMVEDPSNIANGFAVPLLDSPTIFLWPTPPSPGPTFGAHRGWGEMLAIHEYGHIAHLTVASRNGGERFLWRLLPARIGPVARKSPAWVIEGYATYIEGRLTGNGRPNSVGRPAVLRQWALEGQLPKYRELNNTGPYLGGAMRYLAGSAFLEWLAARKGDESLKHLWRRMSAKQRRSFNDAFRGVYGAAPEELYGTFYTEVFEKALEVRKTLRQAGLVEGDLVQRMAWGTGDPAVSRDGSMLAIVVRSNTAPPRVVVWSTADEGVDSSTAWARRRQVEADPLDVAPFDSFPPRKRALATLYPSRGRGHDAPRWFGDGERLLVSRDEPLGDGASRPDLFIWNRKSGGARRVTRGAGIRSADPAPDGKSAVGVRCSGGVCDLVRVDLERGSWTRIAGGSPFVVWHRARLSPDARRIAASVQRDGQWGVSIVDARTGAEQRLELADGAGRYSPSWTADGRVVLVSEAGGIANIEVVDPASGETRTLTRVTGGAAAPDAGPDGRVWFLNLHARGSDVRRVTLRGTGTADRVVAIDPRLAPAARRVPNAGHAFRAGPVQGPAAYALGPRGWRILPGVSFGPDGDMGSLMLASVDPVGKWSTVFQGAYGQRGAWRGGSAMTALRTSPIQLESGIWYGDHAPSKQRSGTFASLNIDSRYTGLGLAVKHQRDKAAWGWVTRAGGSVGKVDGNQLDGASRALGFGELGTRLSLTTRGFTMTPQVAVAVAEGSTSGESWSRRTVTGALTLGGSRRSLRLEGTRGTVTAPEPGDFGIAYEQFAVGGAYLPFIDQAYLSQRVSLPSVPVGYAAGQKFELYRASLRAFGVQPYAIWVAAGDSITRYQRLFGVEDELNVPAIGFARLPATRIRFGIGYSLDQPYDERLRPYVSVTYRP